ncbi:MAG: hypothetical protein R6U21_03730 [Thermoplasmatota archaeon]
MREKRVKRSYIGCYLVLLLLAIPTVHSVITIEENSPPYPPEITGPLNGRVDEYYLYNFTLTDPDEDLLLNLEIKWGDGSESVDCACGQSWPNGTVVIASHQWKNKGNYDIIARVQDSYGYWSNWSEPIQVIMPRNKVFQFNKIVELFDEYPLFLGVIKRLNSYHQLFL